ncbi:hypothetical protein ES705_50000 [subsurface metagenome]
MLKKKEQAISIMEFLVLNYRDAWNHRGDHIPILGCLREYQNQLKKIGNLSEDELMGLYLKAKIQANKEKIKEWEYRILELEGLAPVKNKE